MSYTLHATATHEWPSGGFVDTWTHHGAGIGWEAARDERVARWKHMGVPFTKRGDTYTVETTYGEASGLHDMTTTTELTWEPA